MSQIDKYVSEQRAAGVDDRAIEAALIERGWDASQARRALSGQASKDRYEVHQAVKDALAAIKANLNMILLVAAVGIGLSFGAVIAIFMVTGASFGFSISQGGLEWEDVASSAIVMMALIAIVASLAGAFYTSIVALAVEDGITGNRRSLGELLTTGWQRFVRVWLANILLGLVIYVPIAIVMLALLATSSALDGGASSSFFIFILIITLVTIWVLYAATRLAILPLVALFETDLPILRTVKRTSTLMKGYGQIFFVQLIVLFLLVNIAVSILLTSIFSEGFANLLSTLVSLAMGLIMSGIMVLLYRNRRDVIG